MRSKLVKFIVNYPEVVFIDYRNDELSIGYEEWSKDDGTIDLWSFQEFAPKSKMRKDLINLQKWFDKKKWKTFRAYLKADTYIDVKEFNSE